jgi:uncharacterized membrane protein
MKTNRKVILAVLVVLAVTLLTISASAFVLGAMSSASQIKTTSGTNGYYPNGMAGNQWSNTMSNMMGGNLGSSSSSQTPVVTSAQNSILPLIGLITLISVALTSTGGAVYFFTGRPKIALSQPALNAVISTTSVNVETPYDSVSKTLTVDERKVVDVLASHDGEYLQKYMRTETGLSRLKIHRIVTRLAERGIVTLEQSGNTNKVFLSSWLAKRPFSKINPEESNQQEMVIEA